VTVFDGYEGRNNCPGIIGGLAVYAHGYERTTRDCDILLSKTVNMFLSINKYLSEYDYFLIRITRNL
jgi:hypothetical protein